MVNDTYDAIMDINKLQEKYKNSKNKDAYNGEILKIMLSYNVVTKETTKMLIDSGKLNFPGAQENLINQSQLTFLLELK